MKITVLFSVFGHRNTVTMVGAHVKHVHTWSVYIKDTGVKRKARGPELAHLQTSLHDCLGKCEGV